MIISSFILVVISIINFYITKKTNLSYILLFISLVIALYYENITFIALPFLLILGISIYAFYNFKKYKFISFSLVVLLSIALAAHIIPGFQGYNLIEDIKLSTNSAPYSIWLSFDKVMISVLFILLCKISFEDNYTWVLTLKKIFLYWGLTLISLVPIAIMVDYLVLDIKLPSFEFIVIWSFKMLFFTVLAEELFFRYFLLNAIKEFASKYKYKNHLALFVSSLLFGLAHFGGGFEYIFLAFIAGLFYGAVYLKTNKIESAILLHFFINFVHLLLLSYPYAIL